MTNKQTKEKKERTPRTFSIPKNVYEAYSKICNEKAINMSRRVEQFIEADLKNIGEIKNLQLK